MALTRKMLKAMGIEEEKIDQIIEAHGETVDGLKGELTNLKESNETLITDNKKIKKVNEELQSATVEDKTELVEELEKEIEGYKQMEELTNKKQAYLDVLKLANIDEKRFNSILKLTDFNSIELEDGKIKNAEELAKTVNSDYSDFVVKTQTETHQPTTPPSTGEQPSINIDDIKKMSPEQINNNWDTIKTILKGD